MRSDVRRLIEACIDRLPEAFRTVFMLRAVEELSVEEVADALQLPEATVRTRYFRARGLLREGLSRDIDLAISDAFSFAGARCDRIVAGVLAKLAEDRTLPVMSSNQEIDMSFLLMPDPVAARRLFLGQSGLVLSGAAVALLAGKHALAAKAGEAAARATRRS